MSTDEGVEMVANGGFHLRVARVGVGGQPDTLPALLTKRRKAPACGCLTLLADSWKEERGSHAGSSPRAEVAKRD